MSKYLNPVTTTMFIMRHLTILTNFFVLLPLIPANPFQIRMSISNAQPNNHNLDSLSDNSTLLYHFSLQAINPSDKPQSPTTTPLQRRQQLQISNTY
jgi:hypothetical protein